MSFAQSWNFLMGQVPEINGLLAPILVNKAWSDIRGAKTDWSFLVSETVLTAPEAIQAGSVTVTQDSPTVTTDAAAKAALDPQAGNLPGYVFRAGGAAGPVYRIASYDTVTGNLTLDRSYYELSAAGIGYLIYKAFYKPPSNDFEKWLVLRDPITGYKLRLDWTRPEVDRVDPQRGAIGQNPLVLAAKDYDTDGVPQYELWPHPTVRKAWQGLYARKGTDLSDSVDLPFVIPRELLEDRALYRAYEWAEANAGRFPETLKDRDFRFLMDRAEKRYLVRLQQVKIKDDEIFNSQWGESYVGSEFPGIIDAKYWQTAAPWGVH